MRLQHLEKSSSKPLSTLRFGYTDRAVEIAVGRRRKIAQHSLNNGHMRFRCERSPQHIANNLAFATANHKRFLKYGVPKPIGCLTNRYATASLCQISFLKDKNAGNIVSLPKRNIIIGNQF